MSFSVSLDISKLNEIVGSLKNNRDQVTKACAFYVLGEARQKAPVRTGFLKDNSAVNSQYAEDGYQNVEFYAEYAPYVELGTHKMRAKPFLTPAAEKGRERLVALIKEGLIK